MAGKVTRLGQMERTKVMDDGRYKDVVEISFMVDNQGPFTVDIPKDGYNVDTVRAAVQEYADRVSAVAEHFEAS